jgi:tetratricopeptide (TPR) repeat protein
MKNRQAVIFLVCLGLFSCASPQTRIKQAQEKREKDPEYQYNVGLEYLNRTDVDDAIKYLNKALALNPRHYQSLNALGLAYSMRGNFQESVNYYQKCLVISPDFADAHNNLGMAYQELGYVDKAEEEFKKAVENSNYTKKDLPYCNLARLYFLRQDFEKARLYVDYAIKLNSRSAQAYYLQGLILENQNNIYGAIESFKMAVKIVPDDTNSSFRLGEAYFKSGELHRAAEILEKIAPQVTDAEMKEKLNSYLKTIKEKGAA